MTGHYLDYVTNDETTDAVLDLGNKNLWTMGTRILDVYSSW